MKSPDSLEPMGSLKDYRRIIKALDAAYRQVVVAMVKEMLPEDRGEAIVGPGKTFLAGLKLGGRLTGEEAKALKEQVTKALIKNMVAFEDPYAQGPSLNFTNAGVVKVDGLRVPIVGIPKVSFDPSSLKPEQVTNVERRIWEIRDQGSVMLQLNIVPAEVKGGFARVNGQLPEGLGMVEDPDTKVEVCFSPGFMRQEEMARAVLSAVLGTSFMASKANPQSRALLKEGNVIDGTAVTR